MMNRAAVHEHRITKSEQRLRRDLIELSAIIDGTATYSTPKLKARAAKVLAEVDIHGDEVRP